MPSPMVREYFASTAISSMSTSGASPSQIGFNQFSGGVLHMYAVGNASVVITFYSIITGSGGTDVVLPLKDKTGTPVSMTLSLTGSTAVPFPDECFGCHKIGMVASVAGVMYQYTLKG